MALRLSKLFGNSVEQWLDIQRAVDVWEAEQSFNDDIEPLHFATA
jgi:plasmid maintenance system antidote protein VapI